MSDITSRPRRPASAWMTMTIWCAAYRIRERIERAWTRTMVRIFGA